MELKLAARNVLDQLDDVLRGIKPEDYNHPVNALNGATIGQHIRHTLEFFTCLLSNYNSGRVCYDKRDHDHGIENNKELAAGVITSVLADLEHVRQNENLILEAGYDQESDETYEIPTNFERELAYNIEHAIHHMALVKVGINERCPYLELPANFGVASSTIRYLKQQKYS